MVDNKKSGSMKITVAVPGNRITDLIALTLPQCKWTPVGFSEDFGSTAATRKKQSQAYNIYTAYDLHASVTWNVKPDDDKKFTVRMTVEETEGNASERECQAICAEFFTQLKQNLQVLEQNPVREKSTYGTARFADIQELAEAGYILAQADVDHRSWFVAPGGEGRVIAIPPEEAMMHAVVCGATGTGKTSSFLIPQAVLRLNSSAIFTEATDGSEPPALYAKTAQWRHEQAGHDIYYFNPADLTSNQINLVTLITKPEESSQIANLIVQSTKQTVHSGGDPFWEKAESYLLNALLIHAAGQKSNLAAIRRMVQQDKKQLEEDLSNSYYQRAREEYDGFLTTGSENTRGGVYIGLLQRLQPWTYPTVEKITENTDFDIKGLAKRLFSFYMAVPAEQEDIQPVAALVLNYLLDVATAEDPAQHQTLAHPMFLLLDEFTNFGRIPAFAKKMAIIRHRGIGVTLGFQSIRQLQVVYGRDEADWIMSQPGTRVFLRPRDHETAESISRMLGPRTHYERKYNGNGQLTEREVGVPLMSAADVLALEKDKAILFTASTKPIKIDRFHWKDFEHATKLPPWTRRKLKVEQALQKADSDSGETPVTAPSDSRDNRDDRSSSYDERPPDF